MKESVKAALIVLITTCLICMMTGLWKYYNIKHEIKTHQYQMNMDVDSSLGINEIPEDNIVDNTFTTHLPILVIDTNEEEIINYRVFDEETDSYVDPEDINPWVNISMSIIDNENHVNMLSDVPVITVSGGIKVRGNDSAAPRYPKKQYRIELYDKHGVEEKHSLLGMEEESVWILNGTQRDKSYIRNYMAYNITRRLFPYNADTRYCEMVLKTKDGYEYMGLFILYESIKRGPGRVELNKYNEENAQCDYLIRRDRYNKNGIMLDLWSNKESTGYLSESMSKSDSKLELIYPKENINDISLAYIEQDINNIERLLYESEKPDYNELCKYIDMESFVNYFIINEFFANYDAGLHSTYLYKRVGGKLTIGPIWDFDNAIDNASAISEADKMAMQSMAWFECLVKIPEFTRQVQTQYRILRENELSDSTIVKFIDDTRMLLGNAVLRDESRWKKEYKYFIKPAIEKDTAITIIRDRSDSEEEIQRLKDFLLEHAEYLDRNISSIDYYNVVNHQPDAGSTLWALCFLMCFFVSIILIQRGKDL